jgi:hypothetical protein
LTATPNWRLPWRGAHRSVFRWDHPASPQLGRESSPEFHHIRIALTQAKHHPEARAYLERRVSEGKTRREALRALKPYIIRAVWKLWQECGLAQLEVSGHTVGSTEKLTESFCPQEGMAISMVS